MWNKVMRNLLNYVEDKILCNNRIILVPLVDIADIQGPITRTQ